MIFKSNNNSYHDGTSAFFNVLSEKDPHLNAVEYVQCHKKLMEQSKGINKIEQYQTKLDRNFDVIFCVNLGCYDQNFLIRRETGHPNLRFSWYFLVS